MAKFIVKIEEHNEFYAPDVTIRPYVNGENFEDGFKVFEVSEAIALQAMDSTEPIYVGSIFIGTIAGRFDGMNPIDIFVERGKEGLAISSRTYAAHHWANSGQWWYNKKERETSLLGERVDLFTGQPNDRYNEYQSKAVALYAREDSLRQARQEKSAERADKMAQKLCAKYQTEFEENSALLDVMAKENILSCLTELRRVRLSYEVLDLFVQDLVEMKDGIKTNVPSLISLYEFYSCSGAEKAMRKFAPSIMQVEGANGEKIHAHDAQSCDGWVFTRLLASYVREEHIRLTGRTPEESIANFKSVKSPS